MSLTKMSSTTLAAAAIALIVLIQGFAGTAEANPRFGSGLSIGLAAGATFAAGLASAHPVYLTPGNCRMVDRYDRFGNLVRTMKVCDSF